MKSRSRHSYALLAILVLAFVPACDNLKGPEGPPGPVLTGDLVGFAYLRTIDGKAPYDYSGITVTAEGTGISAVTGADGRWVLSSLRTGTYTVAFSKPLYGTTKYVGFQFVGGEPTWLGTMYLYVVPMHTVTGFSANVSSGNVNLAGSYAGTVPVGYRSVRIFAGLTASVSSDPGTYLATYNNTVYSTSTTFSFSPSVSSLLGNSFSSGQTVYLVAYTENAFANESSASYLDLRTGRYWFASLNPTPSNVVSIVVP